MCKSLDKKWFIAQIKPNSYNLAIRNLERQEFETYLPKMKITIKKEKKFINKDVSVFPGYIFVGVSANGSNWTKINSTLGVSKVLVFNKKPPVIPCDLIVALKKRYDTNIDLSPKEVLQKGDKIKFHSGPFVNLLARIESVESANRIWVLLEVMGGYRKLKLHQTDKYIKV